MTVPPAADGSRPMTVSPATEPGPPVTIPPAEPAAVPVPPPAPSRPATTVPPPASSGPAMAAPPDAGPARAMAPPPVARLGFQGHFAGLASRFVAYLVDIGIATGVFTLAVAGTAFVVSILTNHSVSWNRTNIVVAVLYFGWLFLYFAYSWGASGRTLGMAALGVKVVSADGADATARQAVIRTLAFPLSFLFFGLGFLGIVVQRDRRALHDLIAGTAVVYSWDARSARLRFLARDKSPAQEGRFTHPG